MAKKKLGAETVYIIITRIERRASSRHWTCTLLGQATRETNTTRETSTGKAISSRVHYTDIEGVAMEAPESGRGRRASKISSPEVEELQMVWGLHPEYCQEILSPLKEKKRSRSPKAI